MPLRTVASQNKNKNKNSRNYVLYAQVLFTAFCALLSLDSLFWVGLF